MGIPFPSRVQISLCLDGRKRPSAVLPPVASRCGGMSVAVLVVHLGGIWSDRAIGKAARSLPCANIIMPVAYTLLTRRGVAWNARR